MLALLAFLLPVPQEPALEAVLHSESRRIAVTARVAPAVCSVMDMDSAGGGSGVIIDPLGFVLTNFHVVGQPDKDYKLPDPPEVPAEALEGWQKEHAGADEAAQAAFKTAWQAEWKEEHLPHGVQHWKPMKVGLPDGRLYRAEVLGIDPGSDLAVLKLEARGDGKPWPAVSLGDSDDLLVGETVFAMGNPFLLATDFTPTVTFGIVSGTHRYQEGQGNRMLVYPDCIQVDAAVNPGNSGGPLFNEAGEVVGINGRISVGERGRVNVGVGFAIASNQIRNFLGDLLAGRHAEHGTLDMSAWYMTGQNEERKHRGVFVQQTFKDSVAAAAGVKLGDEITRFNNTAVRTANQLATLVGVLPAGAWVSVTHKPMLEFDKGYGVERTVYLQLASMDTGSSAERKADNQRLASRQNRRIATEAVLRPVGAGEPDALCAELSYLTPIGDRVRIQRRGAALRIDLGERSLVLGEDGKGFQQQAGATTDLEAEGRARLERELHCNPFLFRGAGRRAQLQGALLTGGVHVHGHPAYRLALPGEGEMEIWYFADGRPAGCTFRDPIRRQRVEFHVCPPGAAPVQEDTLLVVADGKLEHRWRMEGPDYRDIPAERFVRPR
jgi:S1-C subfamily serine protease